MCTLQKEKWGRPILHPITKVILCGGEQVVRDPERTPQVKDEKGKRGKPET